MLEKLMFLCIVRLAAIDRHGPFAQIEVFNVQRDNLTHLKSVFDEQAHKQRIPGLKLLITFSGKRLRRVRRFGFQLLRLAGQHQGRLRLFCGERCRLALSFSVPIHIDASFRAEVLDDHDQIIFLIVYRTGIMGQDTILANNGEPVID